MFGIEGIMNTIGDNHVLILNGVGYAVNNCVGAIDDEVIKIMMYITNDKGQLIKVSVESVNIR